ncbi:MAG TPA: hypothetical protein VLM83_03110 [Anaerolineales bacterium]|nr:hypothetical protein [Anaerolineales bacterium]
MKYRTMYLIICGMTLICFLGGSMAAPAIAEATPQYTTTQYPPRPPENIPSPVQNQIESISSLTLPPLKAVLLVGPIDGNTGEWTLSEISNMELAADVLEANGVTVFRFYPGNQTFTAIEEAANGAHFLLYRGHGVYDGNLPYPNVGGFMLSSGYYSPDRIRTYMHLAPNAIVMLYGCFTAGSSSAEGDLYDIGITEAGRRVSQYSDPFFDIGAAGYYANWFGNAFEIFLLNLFAGQTLGQAYENFFDFNPATVYRTTHLYHPTLNMWLDKDYWDGYWQYNNAFAGRNALTLEDLFQVPTLGGLPTEISFVYSSADGRFSQEAYWLSAENTSGSLPLTISLEADKDWISLSTQEGITPLSFEVRVNNFDPLTVADYHGAITVSASTPEGYPVASSPQTILVHFYVVEGSFLQNYIPITFKSTQVNAP